MKDQLCMPCSNSTYHFLSAQKNASKRESFKMNLESLYAMQEDFLIFGNLSSVSNQLSTDILSANTTSVIVI